MRITAATLLMCYEDAKCSWGKEYFYLENICGDKGLGEHSTSCTPGTPLVWSDEE